MIYHKIKLKEEDVCIYIYTYIYCKIKSNKFIPESKNLKNKTISKNLSIFLNLILTM